MDRFAYLMKQKNRALRVFESAKNQLNDVITQYEEHITRSDKKITDHTTMINEERQAIEFARREIESHKHTVSKIDAILN